MEYENKKSDFDTIMKDMTNRMATKEQFERMFFTSKPNMKDRIIPKFKKKGGKGMARVKISFEVEVDDSFLYELKSIAEYKLDYLIDLTEFPEIESVSNGEFEVLED